MSDTTPETPTAICQFCNGTGWYRNSAVACICGTETPTAGQDGELTESQKDQQAFYDKIKEQAAQIRTLAAQLAQAQGEREELLKLTREFYTAAVIVTEPESTEDEHFRFIVARDDLRSTLAKHQPDNS